MGKLTCHCRTSAGPLPGQRAEGSWSPTNPACRFLRARRKAWALPRALRGDAALREDYSHVISARGSLASLTEPVTIKPVHFSNPSISSCICTRITSTPAAGLTLRSEHLRPPLGLGFTPCGGSPGPVGLGSCTRDPCPGPRDPLGQVLMLQRDA